MILDKIFDELDKLEIMLDKFSVIANAIKKRPGLFTVVGVVVLIVGVFVTFTAYKQYKTSGAVKSKATAKEVTLDTSKQKDSTVKNSKDEPKE